MKLSLKALRTNLGWNREKAAQKYGICVDTLYNYEKYKTYPDAYIINNILKATNMKYEDIDFINETDLNTRNE